MYIERYIRLWGKIVYYAPVFRHMSHGALSQASYTFDGIKNSQSIVANVSKLL